MAKVTNWLKSLSTRWRDADATLMASYDTEACLFDVVVQSKGQVLRCRLTLHEVTTLYGSIVNYLSQAKYLRGRKET
jgi:hypothetical protein